MGLLYPGPAPPLPREAFPRSQLWRAAPPEAPACSSTSPARPQAAPVVCGHPPAACTAHPIVPILSWGPRRKVWPAQLGTEQVISSQWISTYGPKADPTCVPGSELVWTLLSTRESGQSTGRPPGERLSEGLKAPERKTKPSSRPSQAVSARGLGRSLLPGAGGWVWRAATSLLASGDQGADGQNRSQGGRGAVRARAGCSERVIREAFKDNNLETPVQFMILWEVKRTKINSR